MGKGASCRRIVGTRKTWFTKFRGLPFAFSVHSELGKLSTLLLRVGIYETSHRRIPVSPSEQSGML